MLGGEIAVVVALLAPGFALAGAIGCGVLLVLYSSAIVLNLARGRRHIDCGCLGPSARQTISGGLVLRNVALVGVCALVAIPISDRPATWVDAATITFAVAVAALLYLALQALTTLPGPRRTQ